MRPHDFFWQKNDESVSNIYMNIQGSWLRSHTKSGTLEGSMSDTAIQHKRVKMGMSDTEISTFWGAKIQHFWASQEYNIYMHIQGS